MPDLFVSGGKSDDQPQQPTGQKVHSLAGHSHNPLTAFSYCPDNVSFEIQEQGEKVMLLLRQHPIVNIPWIVLAVILALAPSLLGFFPLIAFLPANFQLVAVIFWYLIVTAFVLEQTLSWFFNVYIVTDERIIDVDFINLIYREISDAEIIKIQDVTYHTGGVIPTLLNYGDVLIQTAGTVPNFEFGAVPNPAEVARILQELRGEKEQELEGGRDKSL